MVVTLRADAIEVSLGGRVVLGDASVEVRPGAVVAVVGPNGSGKSTLLRCLSGELAVRKGLVSMDGTPLRQWEHGAMARRRAVLTQNVDVAFEMSAAEVTMLGRFPHNHGIETARDRAIVEDAMRTTGVSSLGARPFPWLSGGEKQRVQLARALAQIGGGGEQQRYLLLDEPLAALDPAHQHETMAMVRAVAGRDVGVFVILHDLSLAARYADEVVVLHSGRIVETGPARRALRSSRLRRTFGLNARLLLHRRSQTPIVLVEGLAVGSSPRRSPADRTASSRAPEIRR